MKKTLHSTIVITLLLILIINIFLRSNIINETIIFATELFIKNIFPSLFPMFIISSMLIDIKLPIILGNILSNIVNKLFKVKKEASFVFIMSMLTGFPSSAKYINDLLNEGLINDSDAEKMLNFTFFSNPLFIVNTVGTIFLNNKTIGFLILISHIFANIILGIILRNKINIKNIEKTKINLKDNLKKLNNNINNTNILKTLLKAIKNAFNTFIIIYGIITCFLIILNLITARIDNIYLKVFLSGILEMTSGLKYLSLTNYSIKTKALISVIFISFGGLSIHSQIFNILETKKVKYLPFLKARILHALISFLILLLLLSINL